VFMRRIGILLVVVTALALTGCTSPQSSTTDPITPDPMNELCVSPKVDMTPLDEPGWEFTVALLREPDMDPNGEFVTLLDEPITNTLNWSANPRWLTQKAVSEVLSKELPSGQGAPGFSDVDRFLRAATDNGRILGYAVLDTYRSQVLLTCADGRALQGVLLRWSNNETGVVVCGDPASAPEGSVAAQAQAKFCP